LIAALKARGQHDLVRVKEEVNRQAVLAAPGSVVGVKGITVKPGAEVFFVKPAAIATTAIAAGARITLEKSKK